MAGCGSEDGLDRLRQAQGQLGGLVHMIETGRDCTDVLTLLAAIIHALHRAGFRLVASELEQCVSDPGSSNALTVQEVEKLFLSLG